MSKKNTKQSSVKKQNTKQSEKQKQTTRQLIGIEEITDFSIKTLEPHGELVYFTIKPSNIAVLSETSVSAKIYSLMTVLKGLAEIEILCLNSKENFGDNKIFLNGRMEEDENPVIRNLLRADMNFLDRIQVQMATARLFLVIIRIKDLNENELFPYLNRIEKMLKEQGFITKQADKEQIKQILGVYFEQNVTTEKFENFDGERWVIMND